MAGKASRRDGASTYVALLRGINVGGKNKLPMKELAELFAAAGCQQVQTYIQSGNVVFRASRPVAAGIADVISTYIADRFGYQVPVVVRRAAELAQLVADNPFLRAGADIAHLHVAFLARRPNRAAQVALDPDRSAPDRFEVRGSEIFLHCPRGMARTKLTNAYFDAKLSTTSTMRNWKTVLKLRELTAG